MNAHNSTLVVVLCFIAVALEGCSKAPPTLAEPIKSELENSVAKMACIRAESFPFVADSTACLGCDALVEAGLLVKEMGSETPVTVRYELSDIGKTAYVPGSTGETGHEASTFCFGKAHLLKITRIFGPVTFGKQKHLGIRYIAQLDDPNPYIFDPRAKLLRIPLPSAAMPGKPALYAEQDLTAIINANNPNDFYLDASFHIGPIGEK